MEGKSSDNGSLMPEDLYASQDLQGAMQVNGQQNQHSHLSFVVHPQQVDDIFPFGDWDIQQSDQSVLFLNCNNEGERLKNVAAGVDKENVSEEGFDRHDEDNEEKTYVPWERVKWTNNMVKLLITAVSYAAEAHDPNGAGRSNILALPKKGKWKAISNILSERGFRVSPRQCEDKFNELNKKYKRLNDILGRGNSCKIVAKPALLDLMDISSRVKEEVRKILNSKQFFYEEMCSYYNGNCLFLPHDRDLQRSLQVALTGEYYVKHHEERSCNPDKSDGEDESAVHDVFKLGNALHKGEKGTSDLPGVSAKKKKQCPGYVSNALNINGRLDPHPPNDNASAHQHMMSRSLQLEEKKLQTQAKMLELEKQRFLWLRFSKQQDQKLEKMRLENEFMKLETVRLEAELKLQEIDADSSCILPVEILSYH